MVIKIVHKKLLKASVLTASQGPRSFKTKSNSGNVTTATIYANFKFVSHK